MSAKLDANKVGAEVGAKQNFSTEETEERVDEFQFISYQVTTKGSEEAPAWTFEVKTGEPVLKNYLPAKRIGTVKVTAKPCRIKATFEVSKRDVCLTGTDGWTDLENTSLNKMAVIQRIIVLHKLGPKLEPYISLAELRYD